MIGGDRDAAGAWRLETRQNAQQSGLAAAGRSDNCAEAATRDVERDVIERDEWPGTRRECLVKAGDSDLGCRRAGGSWAGRGRKFRKRHGRLLPRLGIPAFAGMQWG